MAITLIGNWHGFGRYLTLMMRVLREYLSGGRPTGLGFAVAVLNALVSVHLPPRRLASRPARRRATPALLLGPPRP